MTIRSNLVGAAVLTLALATSTVQAPPKKAVPERRDIVTKIVPRESRVDLADPAAALVRLSAIIAVVARLRGR
jgi:hypothetical protein